MHYAIDGNNLLLGLRVNKKPSARLFARTVHGLLERGHQLKIYFDHSIVPIMQREGLAADWRSLEAALAGAKLAPELVPHADSKLQDYCTRNNAAIINSSDKMDSWRMRPRVVHRVRATRRGRLLIMLDDATGKLVLKIPSQEAFELGGVSFPSLEGAAIEPMITPDPAPRAAAGEGTLLVLALDASASMAETTTFDGRAKSAHLNDIVKAAIQRMRSSTIEDGLYLAILRFETDVVPLMGPEGAPFASIQAWYASLSTFDYLAGVQRRQTNLRLALQQAKELVQNTLADQDEMLKLADAWRAAVVLVTDGKHVVPRADGTYETDSDVGQQAMDIHNGLTGLIGSRIDVGCVGIGADVNRELLQAIASPCTATHVRLAKRAGLDNALLGGRLCVHINSNDVRLGEVIRGFIDVASARR